MRHIPVGVEARLPRNVIPSARKPRMPALDRVLYLQAGVQDQVRTNSVLILGLSADDFISLHALHITLLGPEFEHIIKLVSPYHLSTYLKI